MSACAYFERYLRWCRCCRQKRAIGSRRRQEPGLPSAYPLLLLASRLNRGLLQPAARRRHRPDGTSAGTDRGPLRTERPVGVASAGRCCSSGPAAGDRRVRIRPRRSGADLGCLNRRVAAADRSRRHRTLRAATAVARPVRSGRPRSRSGGRDRRWLRRRRTVPAAGPRSLIVPPEQMPLKQQQRPRPSGRRRA